MNLLLKLEFQDSIKLFRSVELLGIGSDRFLNFDLSWDEIDLRKWDSFRLEGARGEQKNWAATRALTSDLSAPPSHVFLVIFKNF